LAVIIEAGGRISPIKAERIANMEIFRTRNPDLPTFDTPA
jgi:hypothetical protein